MGDKTGIEWTDATWNAVTGCDHVSAGCDHCYAETLALRLQRIQPEGKYRDGFAVRLHEQALTIPLKWREPRRVFVNSMSDQWHVEVPDTFTDRMFAVMASTPQHTFQILTKRPQRAYNYLSHPSTPKRVESAIINLIADYFPLVKMMQADRVHPLRNFTWPLPNVWIGTSVEDSRVAHRTDALRRCPAAVRFLSCEPLIGPLPNLNLDGIGWVIAGGESGPGHRPVQLDWLRDIRDQCLAADVPFFFKQWGGLTPKSGGKVLDGREWCQFPEVAA
jgi:protein gp37